MYGSDGDGPSSSQPMFWPENRDEVECKKKKKNSKCLHFKSVILFYRSLKKIKKNPNNETFLKYTYF